MGGLKAVESLLSIPHRRERFTSLCVEGTHLAAQKWKLERPFIHLYDKRWGEVLKFCQEIMDVLPLLRSAWNTKRYKSRYKNEREEGSGNRHRKAHTHLPVRILRRISCNGSLLEFCS